MKYDVVVIGASSAGLYAAELLARHGKQVILFEQANSIQPSRRTYIITSGLFRVMPEINPDLILHRTNTFHLKAGLNESTFNLSYPDLTIERHQMISNLYSRAIDSGAEVELGAKFLGLSTESGITQIQIQTLKGDKNYQADFLIGADGLGNSVGKAAGLRDPVTVPLLQAEIAFPPDWKNDETKVWFDVEDTRYFYWFIPESTTKGVLGLIADPGIDIRKLLDRFLVKLKIQPQAYQAGKAALHSPNLRNEKQVGNLKIFRVGDAAGQVKNTTVGGSVTGFFGGNAAADAILNCSTYRKSLRKGKRELDLHYFIRQLLGEMSQSDYDHLISYLSPAVLSFLSKNDRDSMRIKFWRLPLLQPRFAPLGIKLLFKWLLPSNGS